MITKPAVCATAAALTTLLAVACGGGSSPAAPTATTAPAASPTVTTPPPGPQAYIAAVRAAGLGDRDVANASAAQLLKIARVICDGMDSGIGYQDAISAVQGYGHHVTVHQAAVLVDAAVRNLCPAHLSEIPSGAP